MKEYEKAILKIFLWLPIVLPLPVILTLIIFDKYHFFNSNSIIEASKGYIYFFSIFLAGSIFLGGVQYLLFLLLMFKKAGYTLEKINKNIYKIPLYFGVFYFFITSPFGIAVSYFFSNHEIRLKDIIATFIISLVALTFSYFYVFLFKITCFIYKKLCLREDKVK